MAKQEVVVVTGASAGIGRAIAREFGRHKAKVGLISRGREGLEGARREIEQMGGEALVLPLDVANADAVEAAAEQVERKFGPIDIWVNDAMVSVMSPIKEMAAEEFKRVTEVTYLGYVYGTLAALKRMLPRDRGSIVHVGSALGYRSIPLQSAYCAAKHAVEGFNQALRVELMHYKSNVHTTIVQMPAFNTPQFGWSKTRLPRKSQPVPPIYQPEVGARVVYHAAHHAGRRQYYAAWSAVKARLSTAAPGFADWYLSKTGWKSQQWDGHSDPNRPDNLWEPVDANTDHGAHGMFDNRARPFSVEGWLETHTGLLALAGLGAIATVVGLGTAAFKSAQREDVYDERLERRAA